MIKFIFYLTTLIFLSLLAIFPMTETGLLLAANPETIVTKQQVTAEISMTVASTTLVLLPSIPGLTGGTGNASTTINIITNSQAGYSVVVQGVTKTGDLASMTGDTTSGYFNDYSASSPENWSYNSTGQASQFGFGITNGSLSSANGASGYSTCTGVESCWRKLATTSAMTVVSVNTFTPTWGDNFFLKFRAHIPTNSNPLVPQDWYTSTTVVTAIILPDGEGFSSCGDSVSFTYDGNYVTYGTIFNATTSKCWLDRNLGATQVASSPTDSNAYGDLFQWGRGVDGHQLRTSATTSVLSSTDVPGHDSFISNSVVSPYDWRSPQNNNLWQGTGGINNPCPDGFRLPTQSEWGAEISSWSSSDANGAFASLKLTMGGGRYIDGSFNLVGSSGPHWTSTVGGAEVYVAGFTASSASVSSGGQRASGFSVRCIKD